MARMPAARWRPLPENASQRAITPTQLIIHSAVDSPGPTDLRRYFNQPGVNVESTFWVDRDGTIDQLMDSEVQADANRWANRRAISVETEDEGDPDRIPWTPEQVNSLIRIAHWVNTTHQIPLTLCPDPRAPGVGWHSMWNWPDDPTGQTGRWVVSEWTSARGKTCPGKVRIRQLIGEIMPALQRGTPPMPTNELADSTRELQQILVSWGAKIAVDGDPGIQTLRSSINLLRHLAEQVRVTEAKLTAATTAAGQGDAETQRHAEAYRELLTAARAFRRLLGTP